MSTGKTISLIKALGGSGAGGAATPVDPTLTVAGAAADAEVTGKKISKLTEEISEITGDRETMSVASLNLFDKSTVVNGSWASTTNGKIENYPDNPYIESYYRSDYIAVEGGKTYTFSGDAYGTTWSAGCAFYDVNKAFVSGQAIAAAQNNALNIIAPPEAAYMIVNITPTVFDLETAMLNEGDAALPYEPFGAGDRYIQTGLVVMTSQIKSDTVPLLHLPEEYHLVAGDTFELFYKGIVNAVNPDLFDVVVSCNKGNAFGKRYVWTPAESDVGTHTMSVTLYDYNRQKVAESFVRLVVSAKASSPASNINVLCVGDSLTTSGEWPEEFMRRLVAVGGTPAGDDLSNITFIGTRKKGDVRYEGYGGWRFSHYNTANVDNNAKVITCTHDKTEAADQHSVYKDGTGATWKLETIESGKIKILAISGEGTNFPVTGTLTWVSGGTNHNDIVYTASENGPGNPFWDGSKVDFAKYANDFGATSIDYVYVLLGWNNADTDDETYTQDAQTFIDNVHTAFPNCKIVLMGLQIPARDGLGNNYGANGTYSRYYDLMQHVFRLDDIYAGLSERNSNVYSFNLSGQFDTEHNSVTATRTVNARNSETETYQSNGVHPAHSGYMQIADAAYRDLTHKLQD